MIKHAAVEVVDFFSGCGGTSCGFKSSGLRILAGLDIDADAAATFQHNFPEADFLLGDVRGMNVDVLKPIIGERKLPLLFAGCAPCQPFSRQNKTTSRTDPRRSLLKEFARFVEAWLPEYVFIENVPGMQKAKRGGPLESFQRTLRKLGYYLETGVVPALWYGVPQTRERLVLVASRLAPISIPDPTHGIEENQKPYSTVKDWIDNLPPISAGECHPDDPDHISAALSAVNLQRIQVTPEGGDRRAWPKNLWLDCHKEYGGHTDVYGRLAWDRPAAGLTTRCISYSNGRFGHPDQHRAISVREAACLQTFPRNYRFSGKLGARAKQIGNALCVACGR
jgi:DNA (cytosine-5)-methyltransferase 1